MVRGKLAVIAASFIGLAIIFGSSSVLAASHLPSNWMLTGSHPENVVVVS